MIKKIISVFLCISIILTTTTFNISANGFGDTVYEKVNGEQIAEGLYYEEVERLTTKGWLDFNVLVADTKSDLSYELLVSEDPYGERKELSKLANENEKNIVAAINGDFYLSYLKNTDSIGLSVDDGNIISGYDNDHEIEKGQHIFYQNDIGKTFIDVMDLRFVLESETGKTMEIAAYNKISSLHLPTYIDRRVLDTTEYMDKQYDGIYKFIIKNNMITDIIDDNRTVEIPEDGYVITMNYTYYKEAVELFKIGQMVDIKIEGNIDLDKVEFAISGGGQIVKEGKLSKEPGLVVKSNERHPRTALGISKDGSKVIMMVVDGRGSSIGATIDELASLMIEYGAYDAILLDGGGSSEMVVQQLGDSDLQVVNTPSDGKERRIANGIGLVNEAPSVKGIGGIKLTTSNDIFYPGESIEINVKAYDNNYHPVNVIVNDIKWELDGVDGFFDGNKFFPITTGKCTITANYKGVTETIILTIIDNSSKQILAEELLEKEGTKIGVFGTTSGKNTILDNIVQRTVIDQMNMYTNLAMFVGNTDINKEDLTVPSLTYDNTFSVTDYEDVRIIQLATGNNGVFNTDPLQYTYLQNALQSTTSKYIFITMNKNPLSSDNKNIREQKMFQEIISSYGATEGKEIYLISGDGYSTTYKEIEGIHYINLNGLWYKSNNELLDLQQSFYMVLFNIGENDISYTIKPIYEVKK